MNAHAHECACTRATGAGTRSIFTPSCFSTIWVTIQRSTTSTRGCPKTGQQHTTATPADSTVLQSFAATCTNAAPCSRQHTIGTRRLEHMTRQRQPTLVTCGFHWHCNALHRIAWPLRPKAWFCARSNIGSLSGTEAARAALGARSVYRMPCLVCCIATHHVVLWRATPPGSELRTSG